MSSWWKDPITQAFNPPVEPGEDIGTPFGTPVTALQGGTVTSAVYGPFGGRVDVNVGGSTVEYYQHLDSIAGGVQPGAHVTAGQLLGDSGGQLVGGQHPNSPANSSGPHIEVGETVAGRPVNPSQLIAAGPQVGSGGGGGFNPFDPLGLIANITGGAAPGGGGGSGGSLVNFSVPDPIGSLRNWIASGLNQGKTNLSTGQGWIAENIIPLVVAALIILVVLGAGGKSSSPPQPQIIPVPV